MKKKGKGVLRLTITKRVRVARMTFYLRNGQVIGRETATHEKYSILTFRHTLDNRTQIVRRLLCFFLILCSVCIHVCKLVKNCFGACSSLLQIYIWQINFFFHIFGAIKNKIVKKTYP